jgi:3-isopropylmalate dehydratase small subunit
MKLSDARKALKENIFDFVEIRKNPGMLSEYIVLLHGYDGKSFMLAYENDSVISSRELEHLILMLKEVGFRKARIYF